MRLADFILSNVELILMEWEAFASTHHPAAAGMDQLTLRAHAPEILRAIALDLKTPQTDYQRDEKSLGHAPKLLDACDTGAQTHGLLRARSGFTIVQMTSEYRALRASVLKLWAGAAGRKGADLSVALDDTTRFNEAIDQALIESVAFFAQEVERHRNVFLAVVGHDLRNPLDSIQMTASFLTQLQIDARVSEAASRLTRSGLRMKSLLDDLLDYNRVTLNSGMRVVTEDLDLGNVCAVEVEGFQSVYCDRTIKLLTSGNLRGNWDAARMQQLLANLLRNAREYGAQDEAVQVEVAGTDDEVTLGVHNRGRPIPQELLPHIFDPLKRGPTDTGDLKSSTNLGLGLFIAREIAKAHGGTIRVASEARETAFIVQLPRARASMK